MSALVRHSPDRAVTALEPLTRSDNFATWKRLMTSYLKIRQVCDVVLGDLQRPGCLFRYAKPITVDIHPLVRSRHPSATVKFQYLSLHIGIHVAGLETSHDL
jgi:hypothetical protein